MEFTGTEARAWAQAGKIDQWIQHFLRNDSGAHPNPNVGFAEGLLLEERFYIGPIELPLSAMQTVRVAKDLSDPRELESFRRRVDSILADLPEWDMPPFLLQHRDGGLYLTDGNHRYTALVESGAQSAYAIVWGSKPGEAEAKAYIQEITAD